MEIQCVGESARLTKATPLLRRAGGLNGLGREAACGLASPSVIEEHAEFSSVRDIVDLSSLASLRSLATSPTATSAARTATPTDRNLAKVRDSDDGVRP